MLLHWNDKLHSKNINYGEWRLYEKNKISLNRLKEMVLAKSLLDHPNAEVMNGEFSTIFDSLNVLLLKYIPGQPDFKCCILTALLENYGVCLPQDVQDIILKKLYFPSRDQKKHGFSLKFPKERKFQPGNNVMLRLHENLTLKDLSYVVSKVKHFQKPFEEYLEALVFFNLKKGLLFEKYVLFHLAKLSQAPSNFFPVTATSNISLPSFSTSRDPSTNNLVEALRSTQILIHNILRGTATYSDIIAEDDFLLYQPDREREFAILSEYIPFSGLQKNDCKGLSNVKCMFELFQYASHFKNMKLVFERYHLDICIQDSRFKNLAEMMQNVLNEDRRSVITPRDASNMMGQVKEHLCFKEDTSSQCLSIFDALTKSTAFYQFIIENKYHERQAIFMQQYDLITAQLQHEDYDHEVLDHLRAAFNVITLFMDTNKDFESLMNGVTALNAAIGPKHLETVNNNIILIERWFTRAEVSYKIYIIIIS